MTPKSDGITHHPIGIIHTPHTDSADTPRQPSYAEGIPGTVELLPEYEEGLRGIERYPYIYVIFAMDRAGEPRLSSTPPGETESRGIFATRSPHHPNGMGVSIVRLVGREGRLLRIEDVDMLDGTPVLDIKPYSPSIDVRGSAPDNRSPDRLHESLTTALARPELWSRYTAAGLWADPHIATQMLGFHLNPDTELASRNPDFMGRSVAWIIERFEVGEGKRVLDLGCGPGLYTTPFAKTGADVTGVDFSENSLSHARATAEREGLSIEYVLTDYLKYSPDQKFDIITFIYWDLAPLNPDQRASLLKMCCGGLTDDGAMFLDVPSANYFESVVEATSIEHSEYPGFWSPEDHFLVKATHRYEEDHVSLDKYTIVEPNRTREIYNWLQSFSPESLERELNAAGLETIELRGDVAGAPYDAEANQFAVVARRK